MRGLIVSLIVFMVCWAGYGSSQVTPTPLNPVTGSCAIQGYDVPTLASAKYWNFKLTDSSTWLIPQGVEVDEILTVEVYISVCRALPADLCPVNTQSTTCQHVTLTNGTTIYFDMGSFNDQETFVPLKEDTDGFYAIRKGKEVVDTRTCNQTLSTDLSFRCDPTAQWYNTTPDVSQFLYVDIHNLRPCLYIIQMRYVGACYIAPTLSPGSCQLDGYDTNTISKVPFWFATVPSAVCYNGSSELTCSILFSFCHSLPNDQDSRFNLNSCYKEQASVCQIGENQGARHAEYSMGRFENYTRFSENVGDVAGGFHMAVENGSKPDNGSVCPQGLQTRIVLSCNESITWPQDRDLSHLIHTTYLPADDPCMYVIELQYKGACISEFPVVNDTPSPVGWIFIGLFLFAIAIYLTVGMAVQYFVKGARGVDVIPNYPFWVLAFNLVLEGCKFSLDLITCFQCQGTIKRPAASGVEYDKI